MNQIASRGVRTCRHDAVRPILDTQVLWHMGRLGAPDVTAVLQLEDGGVVMDVEYGGAARQTRLFPDALVAVQWAETLRQRLESVGYHRNRQNRRQREHDGSGG